jgi:hypothetical protein
LKIKVDTEQLNKPQNEKMTRNRPWSKLQREIYDLISLDIHFQIHCVAYPMRRQWGSSKLPRYWITLGNEIIWDYPKDFIIKCNNEKRLTNNHGKTFALPYSNEVSAISQIIREYIDTPKNELFDKVFEKDKWNITEIIRAADRRIGIRRLDELKNKTENPAVLKIIEQRIKKFYSSD